MTHKPMDALPTRPEEQHGKQRKPKGRMVFTFLEVLILSYIGLGIVLYLAQNKLVFPGGHLMTRTPASPPFKWDYEDINLDVDGETTNAWYIPIENASGAVLFSHGNAGTIADRLESIQAFRELGFTVLIYDYGGFGRSTGSPTEKRCYADARAMWHYLTQDRGIPPQRIILFGRSLGGGATTQLATEVTPGAVILESTFLSVPQLAQDIFPFLIAMRPFVRTRFDNAAKVGKITCPKLHIHSPDDSLIPYRHGQRLYELAAEPKEFLDIRGDHNEGCFVSWQAYLQKLTAFLHPLFPQNQG